MKTMNLMAALALIAATHAISTRTASARDVSAQSQPQAIRTFDLPAVRVYATVERDPMPAAAQASVAPRVHDLPAVRVHAPRDTAIDRRQAAVVRSASRRESLAIPRGGMRRGIAPERGASTRADERGERWVALGCMIRMRLARVWPVSGCNASHSTRGRRLPGTHAGMVQASLDRRR